METPNLAFRLGYRPALDGLRAVAILLVMGFHAHIPNMGGGGLGVDIFFVLSGFLITTILIKELQNTGRINLRRFYIRRVLRLFPALVLLITVFVAISAVQDEATFLHTVKASVLVLTYVANWAMISNITEHIIFSHTWSLSIEEQFYTLFPLVLVWVLARLKWNHLPILLLVIIGTINIWRITLMAGGAPWYRIYYGIDTRVDALLWGCWLGVTLAIAVKRTEFWEGWSRRAILPAIATLLLLTITADLNNATHMVVVFPAVAMLTTLILFYLIIAPRGYVHRILEWAPLVAIGKVSYGLYLWHPPIYNLIRSVDISPRQILLYGTPLTIAMTLLSYYLVEKPFLRLSARLATNPLPSPSIPVPLWNKGSSET